MSGVLIFFIVLLYGRSDRFAPEFRFSAVDVIYDSTTTDKDLMQGINAYDAKDGDLTDRIVVEKVVINREKETAVVYYAVADYSGNVTKQSRVFPADIADLDNDGEEETEDMLFPDMNSGVLTVDGEYVTSDEEGENTESEATEGESSSGN